jgi:hypothetical protein
MKTAVLILAFILLAEPGLPAAARAGADSKAGRHALLVGVTRYPNLGEAYQLKGPANDAALLAKLLRERYGFAAQNIHILSEDAGPDRLPERKNIEAEMRRLVEAVRPGDQVLVLLAGHGSLQPQGADARFPQPDGYDRIFLPRDVSKWDGGKGAVPNAIRGDELGAWLRPIAQKKAFLWVILDACHSGQGIRGVSTERTRQVHPEESAGLAIPHTEMVKAADRVVTRGTPDGQPPREPEAVPLPGLDGVTIFYACQAREPTVEKNFTEVTRDDKVYGLLTFNLYQILTQSDAALSYLELAQRVQARYVNLGRTWPTPLAEGKGRSREVLGLKEHPRRLPIRLVEGDNGLKVTAGSAHGLTEGSILAIYPSAGQKGDQPLGFVQVGDVELTTAQVKPCAYRERLARKDLPVGGRGVLVEVNYGDLKLRLGVDPLGNQGKPIAAAERQKLAEEIAKLSRGAGSLLSLADDPAKADWLVRLDSGKVYLVPALGWPVAEAGNGLPPLFGPYAPGDKLWPELGERLGRIARVQNLKKLASDPSAELSRGGQANERSAVQIKLDIRLLKNKTDKKGQPLEVPNPGLQLFDADRIQIRIHNPNPFPVDVTLLYLDSSFGVTCIYPSLRSGELNRLEPRTTVGPLRMEMSGDTVGHEFLLVIAVKAKGEPLDFAALEQPSLERALDVVRKRGGRTFRSPLGSLLERAAFGTGTRAARLEEPDESALLLYSWRVAAHKRPR